MFGAGGLPWTQRWAMLGEPITSQACQSTYTTLVPVSVSCSQLKINTFVCPNDDRGQQCLGASVRGRAWGTTGPLTRRSPGNTNRWLHRTHSMAHQSNPPPSLHWCLSPLALTCYLWRGELHAVDARGVAKLRSRTLAGSWSAAEASRKWPRSLPRLSLYWSEVHQVLPPREPSWPGLIHTQLSSVTRAGMYHRD